MNKEEKKTTRKLKIEKKVKHQFIAMGGGCIRYAGSGAGCYQSEYL